MMLGENLKWFDVFLALAFLINTTVNTNASAADLIVDGTTVMLYGDHEFGNVQIIHGGLLYVKPCDGTAGTGTLVINADSIVVDATSSINADRAGYRGLENSDGEGPGGGEGGSTVIDGGGGGGYGGKGGDGSRDYGGGPDGAGGSSYGSATSMSIFMGSAGGSAGTGDSDYGGFGGSGGGAISLVANTIDIAGTITANGGDGQIYMNDASGGGAGGAILLHAGSVTGSGTLRADGGNGGTSCGTPPNCDLDDGGGGGGGGRIKIFYSSGIISASVSVAGGAGSLDGQDGEEGSYYEALTVNIDIKPGSYPNSINPNAGGVIPVAILGTNTFDASWVDPATVKLEGADARGKGKSGNYGSWEDVDGDGYLDLVVQIVNDIVWAPDVTEATLTGLTWGGIPIEGTDSVRIVPPE